MTVERTQLVDEYVEGGVSVVMLENGQVYALSELATAVLAALDEGPASAIDLGALLRDRFGAPADDLEVSVTRVLTTLRDAGLLRSLSE